MFNLKSTPGRKATRWLGTLCVLAFGVHASLATGRPVTFKPAPPKQLAPVPAAAQAGRRPDPEVMLIDIYAELAQNHLREAQVKADALVEAYPNFRLGHLVRGDLLLMHTRPVGQLGEAATGADARLADLRKEAAMRLQSTPGRPSGPMLPRALLQMRRDQRHALIVDAKRSRLYLYENRNDQIRLVADYYVSQGKLGINKSREGDMRTPVGVYYLVRRLAGSKLPDMYGKGALPTNYPNEWDKVNGRSGSGIWLHGTPPDTFSRAPLATDGCVVVSNDDLNKLSRSIEVGKTPILIGDHVEFVSEAVRDSDRALAAGLVESWRRDIERKDDAAVRSHYSASFKSGSDEDALTWIAHQRLLAGANNATIRLSEPSFFRQPSAEEVIVSSFRQETVVGRRHNSVRKRQYWAREGKEWKIFAESNL